MYSPRRAHTRRTRVVAVQKPCVSLFLFHFFSKENTLLFVSPLCVCYVPCWKKKIRVEKPEICCGLFCFVFFLFGLYSFLWFFVLFCLIISLCVGVNWEHQRKALRQLVCLFAHWTAGASSFVIIIIIIFRQEGMCKQHWHACSLFRVTACISWVWSVRWGRWRGTLHLQALVEKVAGQWGQVRRNGWTFLHVELICNGELCERVYGGVWVQRVKSCIETKKGKKM